MFCWYEGQKLRIVLYHVVVTGGLEVSSCHCDARLALVITNGKMKLTLAHLRVKAVGSDQVA